MNQKEKKLLIVFATILAIGLVLKGVPFAIKSYQAGVNSVDEFKDKRKRLKRLYNRRGYWHIEYDKNNYKVQQLKPLLYVGQSPNLMAGRVQAKLKKFERLSGIKVDSMNLPEFKQLDDWILITQSMTFKASSDSLIKLLNFIANAKPKLIVTDLQIRSQRTLNCTIKVIGFSRVVNTDQEGDT